MPLRTYEMQQGKKARARRSPTKELKKIQENNGAGRPAGVVLARRPSAARRAPRCHVRTHARTHQLVAELERGIREHLPVSGAAAAEDADRAEPARHGGRSVAHVDRPRS